MNSQLSYKQNTLSDFVNGIEFKQVKTDWCSEMVHLMLTRLSDCYSFYDKWVIFYCHYSTSLLQIVSVYNDTVQSLPLVL